MKILVYGTIAQPFNNAGPPPAQGWKSQIKRLADRLLWRVGSTARLDYRNYDAPYSTNSGDIAIAEATRKQIRRLRNDTTFINVNWGGVDSLDRRVLDECDLVVIAGSGYFSLTKEGLALRIVRDLAVLDRTPIPAILYGIGVNRSFFAAPAGEDVPISINDTALLKRFLARMSHIGVRDRASQEMLRRHTDKPVALLGDPALFLNPNIDGDVWAMPRRNPGTPPSIGVNFSFHGPLSTQILKRNLPAYVDLLHTLTKETECSLHYFVHNHSELIIPILLRDSGLPIETICGEPGQLTQRYAEMNVHLGGMLHSCILAVGAGTPCVLLPYDIKHRGFAELLGLEAHCHDATHLNTVAVLGSLRYLLANEERVRAAMRERYETLRLAQENFLRDSIANKV